MYEVENKNKLVSWHCINCGHILTGFKRNDNKVKITCNKCGSEQIMQSLSRRHNRLDSYAPKGMESI